MKLSIWSAFYVDLSPEDMILELEKNGIHYTELADEHANVLLKRGDPKKVGKEFGEFARAHGVDIPQGHLWIAAQICVDTDAKIEILKDWLDLFEAIGIKAAVLHCDRINTEPDISVEDRIIRNVEVLKRLCSYIEGKDIQISLETLRSDFPLVGSAEEILRIIELVGSDRLGICLDTGHFNACKDNDQEKFILATGKYLNALHVNDNDRSADQHLFPFAPPFAKKGVDWISVMRALKQVGYDGLFNYETPGESYGYPFEVRNAKIQYIKKISEYLESIG